MAVFAIYILKLSVSLAAVYLFYSLVLCRLTFYNLNRWYLLGYTLLAFFIPFIDVSPVLQQNQWADKQVIQWVPLIADQPVLKNVTVNATGSFSLWNLISMIVLLGMTVMLVRLLVQFISFNRMKKKAEIISGTDMRIFHVNENIIPFSFGNSIFVNRQLHSQTELEEIIRHEFVHVKQVHSVDIIWGEILCLLNWYNPFAWLLKKSIRQNLEFIADHKVLENGIVKKEYQYLLLKVIGNNQYSIANQFNFSSLKKRIAMMNKLKTAKVHLVKFLFMLPVVALILVSFRKQMILKDHNSSLPGYKDAFVANDTVPTRKKLPSNVQYVNIDNGKATVKLKDGTREEYDLTDESQKNKFQEKYGEIPPPPPPPPAVPTTPPAAVESIPPPPPPPPAPPKLPDYVQRINVNNDRATVWLKNGEKENYDLSVPAQKEKFEKKYGKMQPVPPVEAIEPVAEAAGENSLVNIVSKEFEITTKRAWLKLKDGTVEEYDLTDKKQRKNFEDKYGKIYAVGTDVTNSSTPVAYGSGSGETIISAMAPRAGETPFVIDDYGYSITGKEDVLITITKNTTREQLEEFKTKMKEKDIDLQFDNIDYKDGVLVSISGSMKSNSGRSNFVATDFKKLVLAMIKKGDRTYFKVSVRDDKVSV